MKKWTETATFSLEMNLLDSDGEVIDDVEVSGTVTYYGCWHVRQTYYQPAEGGYSHADIDEDAQAEIKALLEKGWVSIDGESDYDQIVDDIIEYASDYAEVDE